MAELFYLDDVYLRRLHAFLSLGRLVLHRLVFLQGTIAFSFSGATMDKNIHAAVIGRNKTESLLYRRGFFILMRTSSPEKQIQVRVGEFSIATRHHEDRVVNWQRHQHFHLKCQNPRIQLLNTPPTGTAHNSGIYVFVPEA